MPFLCTLQETVMPTDSTLRARRGACAVAASLLALTAGTAQARQFRVIHQFDNNRGNAPYGDIALARDGTVYGTTSAGGEFDLGVLWVYYPDRRKFYAVHYFGSGADGADPVGGVAVDSKGRVFGTTAAGGDAGVGTVFEWQKRTGYKLLASAVPGPGGNGLQGAPAVGPDGLIYGTAAQGGDATCDCGTVWRLDEAAQALVAVHAFIGSDGANPKGPPTFDGTLLRGGTDGGGPDGTGNPFAMDTDGSDFTLIDNMTGAKRFVSGQVRDPAGNLWGVTERDGKGKCRCGALYRIDPDGNLTIVHQFHGPDGDTPSGTPVIGIDGKIYGAATFGGNGDHGTLWSVDPTTLAFEVVHDFTGADGEHPSSRLVLGPDGRLYGATMHDGRFGYGTLFNIAP
jgi:uncharacterized repeat protein (TIGR03803 family)